MRKITILAFSFGVLSSAGAIREVRAQISEDSEAKVKRAVECLRTIPGLIEGNSPEDITNDNAHYVVLKVNRGRLDFPRTLIRLHKGIAQRAFPNIDYSRVSDCMRGLALMQTPK